jgi:hypothetical protein
MSRKKRIEAVVMILALGLPQAAALGQQGDGMSEAKLDGLCRELESGRRVKLALTAAAAPAKTLVGKFMTCDDGEIVLVPQVPGGDISRVPLQDIEALYVSDGRSSHWLGGAMAGLLLGGLAGCVAAGSIRESGNGFMDFGNIEEQITVGVGLTALGILVGLGVGLSSGKEKWRRLDDGAAEVILRAGPRGGSQLAAAWSF